MIKIFGISMGYHGYPTILYLPNRWDKTFEGGFANRGLRSRTNIGVVEGAVGR